MYIPDPQWRCKPKTTRKGFPYSLFLELRDNLFIQRGTYTASVGLLLGNGNWTNLFVTVKLSPLNTRERQMSGLLNSSWMLIPMIYHYLLFPHTHLLPIGLYHVYLTLSSTFRVFHLQTKELKAGEARKHWDDWEMGTAISCTKCSQVAGLPYSR